jgi:hypothetical protein
LKNISGQDEVHTLIDSDRDAIITADEKRIILHLETYYARDPHRPGVWPALFVGQHSMNKRAKRETVFMFPHVVRGREPVRTLMYSLNISEIIVIVLIRASLRKSSDDAT